MPPCMRPAQVKVQTNPGYANGMTDGMPKMISEGGVGRCVDWLASVGWPS